MPIEASAKPSAADLFAACALGQAEVVAQLLEEEPERANAAGLAGDSPLHAAARYGQERVVELLLAYGADPNRRDRLGRTPLAAMPERCTKLEVAELLLAHGADLQAADFAGHTALTWAASQIRRGQAWGCHEPLARRLADEGAELCLFSAVCLRLPGEAADLLAEDPRRARDRLRGGPLGDHATPLHLAVEAGEPALAELLLSHGAEVHARDAAGRTPLELAARLPKEDGLRETLLDLLERHGAVIGPHLAAALGAADRLASLLAGTASADEPDPFGRTPLHLAAHYGQAEAAALLLDCGAHPAPRDRRHDAPGRGLGGRAAGGGRAVPAARGALRPVRRLRLGAGGSDPGRGGGRPAPAGSDGPSRPHAPALGRGPRVA